MANIALPVDWQAIRSAVENTGNYTRVAEAFGVASGTLRQRAKRERWLSPGVVQKAIKRAESAHSNATSRDTSVTVVEADFVARGATYRRNLADKLEPLIMAAALKAPANWKDAEIADKMLRKSLGLESGDNQVNIGINAPGWRDFGEAEIGFSTESAPFGDSSVSTLDVETSESPPELGSSDEG